MSTTRYFTSVAQNQYRQETTLSRPLLTQQREEALERLIIALEIAAALDKPVLGPAIPALPGLVGCRLNQMARLRAAHAAYSLQSSNLHKTGTNAWMRPRRAV